MKDVRQFLLQKKYRLPPQAQEQEVQSGMLLSADLRSSSGCAI